MTSITLFYDTPEELALGARHLLLLAELRQSHPKVQAEGKSLVPAALAEVVEQPEPKARKPRATKAVEAEAKPALEQPEQGEEQAQPTNEAPATGADAGTAGSPDGDSAPATTDDDGRKATVEEVRAYAGQRIQANADFRKVVAQALEAHGVKVLSEIKSAAVLGQILSELEAA